MSDIYYSLAPMRGRPQRGRGSRRAQTSIPLDTRAQILRALEVYGTIAAVGRAAGLTCDAVRLRMRKLRVTWRTQQKAEQAKTARQLIREKMQR